PVLPVLGELLDELDVAPMDAIQPAGVVVAVPTQRVRAAVGAGQLIPLFAGDLAGFTADANRRVCVEPHRFRHTNSRSSLLDVADERLSLVNRHVGIAAKRRQLIDDIAGAEAFATPGPRHSDMMDGPAIDLERTKAACDEGFRSDLRSRARDAHPVEILNSLFLRQLRADLHQQLRLQL